MYSDLGCCTSTLSHALMHAVNIQSKYPIDIYEASLSKDNAWAGTDARGWEARVYLRR